MQDLLQQIATAWGSLTLRQRASLVVSAALTVAAVGSIVWWANQPSWTVLYTGLDPKEAQSIVQELQSSRTPHRLRDGGTVIEVPLEAIDRLRMDLASKNLPGSGRFSFLEMFSQDTIAQSNSMQRIRYQKALEDELARTIESLDEVHSARVHLVLPGERIFLDDDDVAKASVTLGLAGSRAPSSEQVQAIARIVAGAAPELKPEQVSVLDTTGRVLWEGSGDGGGVIVARQVEMQAALEREINAKVARVLEPIVGASRFVVRTTADLDFQKVLREEEEYDPDSGVLVSEQKTKQKSTYGDGAAGGVPGTASNLPDAGGGVGAPASETNESSAQTANFQYSRVKRVVEEPSGSIRRLSVAVLVDQEWEDVEGGEGASDAGAGRRAVPRDDEQIRRIDELVKAAISFDADRGDHVTVEQVPFQPLPEPVAAGGFDPRSILPLVKYPALVVLLLLAFLLFYRPLIRTLREAFGASSAGGAATGGAGATADMQPPLQLGQPSRLELLRQRLTTLANEQPAGMAQTVRVWLHEDEEAS